MSNLFLALPVPPLDGVGAGVDVSTLGATKTIVVCGTFTSQISIEVSDDNLSYAPVTSFQACDFLTVTVAGGWMRVRQSAYAGGTAVVAVGSNDYGTRVDNIVAPAVTGVGAATDITLHGKTKTVIVAGVFSGGMVIEISEDGVEFAPLLGFSEAGIQSIEAYGAAIRVRRVGVTGGATPDVFIASGNDAAAASGCSAILGFGNSDLVGTAEEFYGLDPWFGGRGLAALFQGDIAMVAPRAGTLENLYVRHNAADGNGVSITYTVRVNGANTGLTVSLATGVIGQASDLVNQVSVAQGDRISMRAQMPPGGPGTAVVECFATMEFPCTIIS